LSRAPGKRIGGSGAYLRPDFIYSALTGLTSDDSPILLEIHSIDDIYALDIPSRKGWMRFHQGNGKMATAQKNCAKWLVMEGSREADRAGAQIARSHFSHTDPARNVPS
jgi:hypothetical protein